MIVSALYVFILWGLSVFLANMVALFSDLININLFYLLPTLLILRWKGPETLFISLFFGLTVDVFSNSVYGIFGLVYFSGSFLLRYLAVHFIQETLLNSVLFVLGGLIIMHLGANILFGFFDENTYFLYFFRQVLWKEVVPTALASILLYPILIWADKQLNITLSERNF